MADTERTLTDLLTNLFQDGQAASSITAQDVRDLIVSATNEQILKAASTSIYNDYVVSGDAIAKGASAPTLKTLVGNIDMYAYDPSTMNEGFFPVHILHDYKQGTTPTFHVHWVHNEASPSGNVVWGVEYAYAKGYEAGTFATTRTLTTTDAAGAQYAHNITNDDDMPINAADVANLEPDGVILCRVYRDATNAADTFTGDAFLVQVDLHYEMAQYGTQERNRPFTSAGF